MAKWDQCLALIRKDLGNDAAFTTWFQPTVAKSLRGSHLTLVVPSMFCQELYEGQYFPIFSKALHEVFGNEVKLTYEIPVVSNARGASVRISSDKKAPEAAATSQTQAPADKGKGRAVAKAAAEKQEVDPYVPELNASLSFENFCVSPCNKLPWSIAESIARQPVNSNFNPFFLYGDVGVGKTHLMQAIGLQVKRSFPSKRVVFLPMKEFQRLYQNAFLRKEIPAFLQWFMNCDVLLFDDLQEIAGSGGTLNNALFPIFNHLQQHGKQLVFTCDRPPQDLQDLEARLIDRFKWGIVEKLERPDQALRKKILSFKAKRNGLNLPQDVIDYIASTPLNSVREIEGIVLGMMTRAINLGLDIDMELARQVVGRAVKPSSQKAINFDMVVEAAADRFRLNSDVIFSKSRVRDVADARMVIMYLAQKILGLSTGSIGRKLGRQHSTVIHGIKSVISRIQSDPDFADLVLQTERSL